MQESDTKAHQSRSKESPNRNHEESYLDFLRTKNPVLESLKISSIDAFLEQPVLMEFASVVKADLGIDVLAYSLDARRGLILFLSRMKGFSNRTLESWASVNPVYAGFAEHIPEEKRNAINLVQAYFYNPALRNYLVRSLSLLIDQPDMLVSIVQGRLYANYYGENIGRALGDEVLSMAAELADCDDQILEEVKKVTREPAIEIAAIKSQLRREATTLLSHVFGDSLYSAIQNDPDAYGGFYLDILEPIQGMVATQRIFLASCKQLRIQGALNPAEIRGSEFVTVSGGSFKGVLRQRAEEMVRLQRERYGPKEANYSQQYPEFFSELEQSLIEKINDGESRSRFYLFMHEGKLVGFFRFDDVMEAGVLKYKHLASVIGNPEFKGGKIIETLLEQTLAKEATVPVRAECDPSKPVTQQYLKMGFVKTGEFSAHGLPAWNIELPAKQNQ